MNKNNPAEQWKRMSFKGNKVWAQTDINDEFLIENGMVRIKYNLKQDYEYRVKPENLYPEDQAVPSKKKGRSFKIIQKTKSKPFNQRNGPYGSAGQLH